MFLDPADIRRAFGRAAGTYDEHAVLQKLVSERLMERLDGLNIRPRTILDLGAGTGRQSVALNRRFPEARVIAMDHAVPMLKAARTRQGWFRKRFQPVAADAGALPLAGASVDLVYCNLMIQWCEDLPGVLTGLRRILRPDGLLLLSTFGPDTLRELRAAFARVDDQPHVGSFTDVQQVGEALIRTGFSEPVLDTDWITTTYLRVGQLLAELKAIGATNADGRRRRTLTGPGRIRAMQKEYETYRQPDGRFPATWEVVYASAWGPPEGQPIRTAGGEEASFSIDQLRRRT